MIFEKMEDLIGNTPLLRLHRLEQKLNLKSEIYAKLEYLNPTGSVKDRAAKQMILDAIKSGQIRQDTILIEPTSGNTGIGLAAIASVMGLRIIIVMPDSMSQERINLMRYYGAEVVLTKGIEGMAGAIRKANELAEAHPNSFIPAQFENPSNPKAHYLTTGPEILEDIPDLDYFIAGVGTGGTITGVGKYLHQYAHTRVIAVEPESSPVLSKHIKGPHQIQGIGAGFVPAVLGMDCFDEIQVISDHDAIQTAKLLAKVEGVAVGISSGAALGVAVRIAQLEENRGKKIVVLLPDSIDRYYSTALFK